MISKFRNTGQTCVCANRILVQDGVYDAFAEKLSAAAARLRIGPAESGDSEQGPLINQRAVAKVEEHVGDALAKGATAVTGGKRHALGADLLRADRAHRRHSRDEDCERRDFRAGGAPVSLLR